MKKLLKKFVLQCRKKGVENVYKKYLKRFFDILISLIAMPFLCIIIIIVSPIIFFEDHGSIFYKAKRRGINGKIFEMYKFRSMSMNAPDLRNSDNSTYNAPDDPRVTKVGRVLRKTSIDELPQILNVLLGDMSWIGPRPVTIDRPLSEYDEKRKIRLTVKPGITGYTQAYYRQAISQEEKLQLDAEYAKNISFINDMKIIFKTIQTVFFQKNIYNRKNDNPDNVLKR